jgi:hypothetical protein
VFDRCNNLAFHPNDHIGNRPRPTSEKALNDRGGNFRRGPVGYRSELTNNATGVDPRTASQLTVEHIVAE